MNFTTLEKIKSHLRIDDDAEDDLLDSYIFAASSAVKNYLKSASPYALKLDDDFNPEVDVEGATIYETDTQGERVINKTVEHATLILIGYFYKDRDNNEGNAYEQGYLPKPVTALLYPLRDPALR